MASSTDSIVAFVVVVVVAAVAVAAVVAVACSVAAVAVAAAAVVVAAVAVGSAAAFAAFVAVVVVAVGSRNTVNSRNQSPLAACCHVSDASPAAWQRYELAKWATTVYSSLAMANPCSLLAGKESCWTAPSVVAIDYYMAATMCLPCPVVAADVALEAGREMAAHSCW